MLQSDQQLRTFAHRSLSCFWIFWIIHHMC